MTKPEMIAQLKSEVETLDALMRESRAERDRCDALLKQANIVHGANQNAWNELHKAIASLEALLP